MRRIDFANENLFEPSVFRVSPASSLRLRSNRRMGAVSDEATESPMRSDFVAGTVSSFGETFASASAFEAWDNRVWGAGEQGYGSASHDLLTAQEQRIVDELLASGVVGSEAEAKSALEKAKDFVSSVNDVIGLAAIGSEKDALKAARQVKTIYLMAKEKVTGLSPAQLSDKNDLAARQDFNKYVKRAKSYVDDFTTGFDAGVKIAENLVRVEKLATIVAADPSRQAGLLKDFLVDEAGGWLQDVAKDAAVKLALRVLAIGLVGVTAPFWVQVALAIGASLAIDYIAKEFGDDLSKFVDDLWTRGQSEGLDGIRDHLGDLWNDATNQLVRIRTDPLVFDLDGNGSVDLISRENSNVFFDIDADGALESVGWVKATDGFLVRDINGNGRIDDVNEMFGTLTRSGFAILGVLDSNADQFMSAADTRWGELRMWRDLNQNGVSEANELFTLASLGIVNIDLRAQDARFTVEENIISFKSVFTRANGTTGLVADVWLAFNNLATASLTSQANLTTFADAPDLSAFGTLPTLRTRMGTNASLATLARQAGALRLETVEQLPALVETLLMRWANVEAVNPISRGTFYDARKLTFLEAFMGTPYALNGVPQNVPSVAAANALDRTWNKVMAEAAMAILIQSDSRLTDIGLTYNEVSGFEGVGAPTELAAQFASIASSFGGKAPLLWALGLAALDRAAAQGFADELPLYEQTIQRLLAPFGLDRFLTAIRNPSFSNAGAFSLIQDAPNEILFLSGNAPVNASLVASGTGLVTGAGADVVSAGGASLGSLGIYASTGAGADTIIGSQGGDVLDGGLGADWLEGGAGDDVYLVDNADDLVIEALNAGTDTVNTSIDYRLGANVENVRLVGTEALNATGNDLNNTLIGNAGANILEGGDGDDVYEVNAGDIVIEFGSAGTDTVRSFGTISLGANVENGELLGTQDANISGNDLNNVLRGNSGDNILFGGAGSDYLVGGLGDDTYYWTQGDSVSELVDGGTDTLYADDNISTGEFFEIAALQGTQNWYLTGGTQWNLLVGNSGNNTIDGGGGADDMRGGLGDDTYLVDRIDDYILENTGEGSDTVQVSVNTLAMRPDFLVRNGGAGRYGLGANIENFRITAYSDPLYDPGLVGTSGYNVTFDGNELDNMFTVTGSLSGAVLQRRISTRLRGGLGNDTYVFDAVTGPSLEWVIVEAAGEGIDTVSSQFSYTLGDNFENLVLSHPWQEANGTGNALNNRLTGNNGINVLDGLAGADTMIGGNGGDTYVVDQNGDVVIEIINEGIDTVRAAISYTLGDHVENLELTGSALINGIGNSMSNRLTGNSANNYMAGGMGDDVYVLSSGDYAIELSGQGNDMIMADVSAVLSDHVEQLTLTGSANIDGYGNDQNNTITGNSGNNYIDGGRGNDQMIGGQGDDTYIFDSVSDNVQESIGGGFDTIISSVTLTVYSNIEALILTGDADINATSYGGVQRIIGNIGDNRLDGGEGADTMEGRGGDDFYSLDDVGDRVVERWNDGFDTVRTALATYTLEANVERLELSSNSVAQNGFGNDLDNVLVGNSLANTLTGGAGNDVLDGAGGIDRLVGGSGNDTYRLDTASDVIVEGADEGTDTVEIGFSYILAANIENASLVFGGSFDLNGNASSNYLLGNDWANNIDGAGGADVLEGRAGDDTYSVDNAGDRVIELLNGGTDTVRSTVSWVLGDNLENLTLLGSANIDAYGNDLNNTLAGNNGDNRIVAGQGSDTMSGFGGRDTYIYNRLDRLTDRITDFAVGAAGDIVDLSRLLIQIGYTGSNAIADQVVRLVASGTTTFVEVNATRSIPNPDWVRVVELTGVTRSTFIDAANLRLVAATNLAPVANRPFATIDVQGNAQLLFRFSNDAFIDPEGAGMTYRAEMWNGTTLSALPSWLTFNPSQRVLIGTAVGGATNTTVRITATDDRGATGFADVQIQVRRQTLGDLGGDGLAELSFGALDGGLKAMFGLTAPIDVGSALQRQWTVLSRGDFNGDARTDFVFRNSLTNTVAVWLMNGAAIDLVEVLAGGLEKGAFLGSADFDGDQQTDILSVRATGVMDLWRFNLGGVASAEVVAGGTILAPRGSKLLGTGDVDGDGKADAVWRSIDGVVSVWRFNGATILSRSTLDASAPLAWNFLAMGDLDGDGRAELLWRNLETNAVIAWKTNGLAVSSVISLPSLGQDWAFGDVVDRNGDGRGDIVWRNTSGLVATWLMGAAGLGSVVVDGRVNGANLLLGEASQDTDATRRILSDFDGDGRVDLLWRNANGNVARWALNGTNWASTSDVTAISHEWSILTHADVNGDGKADIIWQNNRSGDVAAWLMNGSQQVSASIIAQGLPRGTELQSASDLTGDGQAELIWREQDGDVRIWSMNAGTISYVTDPIAVGWGFDLLGAADFTGDGRGEILWRGPTNEVLMWSMAGTSLSAVTTVAASLTQEWAYVGAADFDGDLKADILWQNRDTGQLAFWFMNGAAQRSAEVIGGPDSSWRIDGIGDTDGDGKADLVWRNRGSGQVAVWTIDGAITGNIVKQAALLPGGIPPNVWQVTSRQSLFGVG